MARNTTNKYNANWKETVVTNDDGVEDTFDWILPVAGDPQKVRCDLCKSKPFLITNGGIAITGGKSC